jgi:hypothetical protein
MHASRLESRSFSGFNRALERFQSLTDFLNLTPNKLVLFFTERLNISEKL